MDGDVALCGHAGQAQRSVLSGDKHQQDQDAAQRSVNPSDGVAGDKQDYGHSQLSHVVDHRMDEEDVTWVGVEELESGKWNGWTGCI